MGSYHSKKTRRDLMTDLETLGTSDDSVILSIGAISFDPFATHDSLVDEEGNYVCPTFYRVLHVPTQKNRMINKDTMEWWQGASRADAWKEIQEDPNKQHLTPVLDEFWDWIVDNCGGGKAWACAPSFDIDMLSHAFRETGICKVKGSKDDFPIKFWNNMDVRTIEQFVFGQKYRGAKLERAGTFHNALDDCITQAMMLQDAGEKMRDAGMLEL